MMYWLGLILCAQTILKVGVVEVDNGKEQGYVLLRLLGSDQVAFDRYQFPAVWL